MKRLQMFRNNPRRLCLHVQSVDSVDLESDSKVVIIFPVYNILLMTGPPNTGEL